MFPRHIEVKELRDDLETETKGKESLLLVKVLQQVTEDLASREFIINSLKEGFKGDSLVLFLKMGASHVYHHFHN